MSLQDTYEKFIDKKQSGLKAEARRIADELIVEYRLSPDPDFVYAMCETCSHKIDFVLWKELILPELGGGIADDPRAIRGMIQTIQNLYSSKRDWKEFGYITEEQLTIRLLAICPDDAWAKARRTDQLQKWLAYTIHEWPSGVLYGTDGATHEQCKEILDATEELSDLDEDGRFNALCDDVKEKTIQYRSRLAKKSV